MKPRFLTLTVIIFAAAFLRLIPHPYNLAPITAMALFGGAHFTNNRDAYLITLGAMLVSDLFIGLWHTQLLIVYSCFALIITAGTWLQKHRTFRMTTVAALGSSFLFFTVTNFTVWMFDGLYPLTFQGLISCYAAAIPFFHNTLAGDLIYTGVFFGGFALAEKRFPVLKLPEFVLTK